MFWPIMSIISSQNWFKNDVLANNDIVFGQKLIIGLTFAVHSTFRNMTLTGRHQEIKKLDQLIKSSKSELLAIS
jgi:hypothetical protein